MMTFFYPNLLINKKEIELLCKLFEFPKVMIKLLNLLKFLDNFQKLIYH